jgi:hypothetical protein
MQFYFHWLWILWHFHYEKSYWEHCDMSDRFWMGVWDVLKKE